MSQNTVRRLPEETKKLITSTQIITSVRSAVKELIENSIDAGAKVIQVRLENYGLDLIEVKDDGSGVSYDNVQKMFLPGYTSKIREFEDLANLRTYGFRGEALAAVCKIAKVSITTKTKLDSLAMTYEIDSDGVPLSSKPTHLDKGTVITITNLFSNLPVRRSFLSAKKKQNEEFKKTEHIVQALSLIHPELGMSLIHNKSPIWKKNSVKGMKQSFMQVAGLRTVSKMGYINKYFTNINLDLIVPKKKLDSSDGAFTNSLNNVYVYVNRRPVNCKILSRCVQEHIFHHFRGYNISHRYAICLVSVIVPPHEIDVNLEPDKSKVFFKNQVELLKLIDETLKNYYGHLNFTSKILKEKDVVLDDEEDLQPQPKQPRLDASLEPTKTHRAQDSNNKAQTWDVEIIADMAPANSSSKRSSSGDLLHNKPSTSSDCSLNKPSTSADWSLNKPSTSADCSLNKPSTSADWSLNKPSTSADCSLNKPSTSADWSLNKPSTSAEPQPCSSKSLCSQINSDNSCLTREEVSEFNSILNERSPTLFVSKSSGSSEADRNDIQSRPREKPILKEWPSRARIAVGEESDLSSDESEGMERGAEERSGGVVGSGEREVEREDGERGLDEDVEQFDLSLESVSSQLGKKDMKAFTKFARIMQPKITQEYPNMKHIQIAGILADQWKTLTPDEVKYYQKMADVVDDRRKTYHQTKTSNKLPPPQKSLKLPPQTNNLLSMFERINNKNKISRPKRKEIPFNASFNTVKNLRLTSTQHTQDTHHSDYQIIGQLRPSGNWLYKRGADIGHIRHQGLQELIFYQRMLSSLELPRKPLQVPIPVNEENMGNYLWNVLMSLRSEWDLWTGKWTITSDVVVKNGFLVEIDKKEDVISSARITEMVETIPHFGISELKDLVDMYQKNGGVGCLADCRPTAVCNYITNETVRCSGEWKEPPDREELEELMRTYSGNYKNLPAMCPHSREIFPSIYNLENETSDV